MITIWARASSLPSYGQHCPRRWAAFGLPKKLLAGYGIRQLAQHVGAVVGTATHSGAAHLMTEFGRSGEVGGKPRREEAREIDVASLREAAAEGVTKTAKTDHERYCQIWDHADELEDAVPLAKSINWHFIGVVALLVALWVWIFGAWWLW